MQNTKSDRSLIRAMLIFASLTCSLVVTLAFVICLFRCAATDYLYVQGIYAFLSSA